MKIKHENYDRVTVINVSGDITVDELEPLRGLCSTRLQADTRDFVFDFSETDFLDSKALETLLWLQEQAGERLGQVRLAAPTENLRRILSITRLEHHFDTHETVDAALKSLR
jgi:anti-anti-sigma factor